MKLHNYQLKAVDFILEKKKCALYLGLGLGKTIISLTALTKIKAKSTKPLKTLIIGPLRVVNNVWHNELVKWKHTKDLTYSIITGTEKTRSTALSTPADIHLINRENIKWLYEKGAIKWDLIIIDESSSFKNSSSQRFKYLKKFQYNYMIQLTGTPAPNGLLDLWAQIYLLDKGERLGTSMYFYKYTYFLSDLKGYNFTPINPKVIYNRIADITLSMKSEDYVQLPPRIDVVTNVTIPKYNQYKELEKKFIIEIQDKNIVALSASTLSNKLLQFCNGAIYDENGTVVEVHDAKLSALEDIIEDYPDESILVAYNYKSDLERLLKRFKQAVVMDKAGNLINDWNDGKIKLLLCHPASCGKGLNLQAGGNIIVWFGLTWNLEDYIQFNGRLHRQGQTKPVVINHIVASGCIDEKLMGMLNQKNISQENLLSALR
jgi:SNF2 family DNA or RNA helicase